MSDPSVFDDYDKGIKCRDWPGPGKSGDHHVYFLNPLKEFVDSHTAHVDENFEKFKVLLSLSKNQNYVGSYYFIAFRRSMERNTSTIEITICERICTGKTSGLSTQRTGKRHAQPYSPDSLDFFLQSWPELQSGLEPPGRLDRGGEALPPR